VGSGDRSARGQALRAARLLALVLIVGTLIAAGSGGAIHETLRAEKASSDLTSALGSTQQCSSAQLVALVVTPPQADVLPLTGHEFNATAENGCGNPLTQNVSISWWLSSDALGSLNATSGPVIAYTACLAPMAGVLHVRATSGSVSLYNNSSIAVSSWPSPVTNASNAPPGVRWVGIEVIAGTIAIAAAILVVARRMRGQGNGGR